MSSTQQIQVLEIQNPKIHSADCLLRRRSLVEPGPTERSERARFAGCLPFFRVGQGGVLEKQEAAAEEAAPLIPVCVYNKSTWREQR